MPKQTLNTIKNWFRTAMKPTQAQFWDVWDSFWHKDEQIPQSKVENLSTDLQGKAEQSAFQSHLSDENAHPHGHVITDIEGLVLALEGKSDTGHTHDLNDINGLAAAIESAGPTTDEWVDLETAQDISAVKTFLAGLVSRGITINTNEAGTASNFALLISNLVGGGFSVQKRGSTTIVAKGDSMTGYFILRGLDNNENLVFEVRAGGRTKGGDAVNNDEFTTLQQVNTLLTTAGFKEVTFADIAARDAYEVEGLPFQAFVEDDGDGKWAIYRATAAGLPATYTKIMDQDLFNAIMSGAEIAAAYEGYADVERFTTALKGKLDGLPLSITGNVPSEGDTLEKIYNLLNQPVNGFQFIVDPVTGALSIRTDQEPTQASLKFITSGDLYDYEQANPRGKEAVPGFLTTLAVTPDSRNVSMRRLVARNGVFYSCSSNGDNNRFYSSKGRVFVQGGTTDSLSYYAMDVAAHGTIILPGRSGGPNNIKRSIDGGATFTNATISETLEITGVVHIGAGRWALCSRTADGLGNVAAWSEDDGLTWTMASTDGANAMEDIAAEDGMVFMVSNNGTNRCQISLDGGETYTSYLVSPGGFFTRICFFAGHIVIMRAGTGSTGYLRISSDAGATWQERLIPDDGAITVSGMAVIGEWLYLFGPSGYLIRTKDLTTKEIIPAPTANTIVGMAWTYIDGKAVIMAVCENGTDNRILSNIV